MRRALTMANRVRAGTVWVNNYRSTSTTSPFGGFKMSASAARVHGRHQGIHGDQERLDLDGDGHPEPFIRR